MTDDDTDVEPDDIGLGRDGIEIGSEESTDDGSADDGTADDGTGGASADGESADGAPSGERTREGDAGPDAPDDTPDVDNAPDDPLTALDTLEAWHAEGYAARVHYRGAGDYYSVEYYAPSDCVLYWKVKGDGETATPVGRSTVPGPLRDRVRQDLAEAGIDPAVETRTL
jgi:hypothetical protein